MVCLGQGTEPKAFLTGANAQQMAKSEALSRETLGRRKLFRKERRDKVPNLVASYDHAIGGSRYNSYALPAGDKRPMVLILGL